MSLFHTINGDTALFIYWKAINSALPNYTDETIINRFIKDFGTHCEDCSMEALRGRLKRAKAMWLAEQKSNG